MKTFDKFMSNIFNLDEAIHQEIKDIMDDNTYSHKSKLSRVTAKLRDFSSKGIDSGIENSTPKKGSSRAVFFPKEEHEIQLDGKPAKMKTAVKIAFKGTLDAHTGSHMLLGEHQNEFESSHYINSNYGIISKNHDGHYETNKHGVLAPVVDTHEDHHHITMGHARNMSKLDFKNATKTESHPKGLDFDKFHAHLMHDYHQAHGTRNYSSNLTNEEHEEHEHIASHPLTDKVKDFVYSTDQHPADLVKGNWGMWKHPHTGVEHPVIRDFGYSHEVSKLYNTAIKNHQSKNWW
jgi:hypothetical protein